MVDLILTLKSALCRNNNNAISRNQEFLKSEKKLVIFSEINSGFSAKLVAPPLDGLDIKIEPIATTKQIADLFTKGLSLIPFETFRRILMGL